MNLVDQNIQIKEIKIDMIILECQHIGQCHQQTFELELKHTHQVIYTDQIKEIEIETEIEIEIEMNQEEQIVYN